MLSPLNPLEWVRLAQDWFRRTERSSGFRPFLIYLLIVLGFAVVVMVLFPASVMSDKVLPVVVAVACLAFIVLFGIKAFQDPEFCRSEKHVENVRRLDLAQQKGEDRPRIVDATTEIAIENPKVIQGGGRTG